MPWHDMYGHFPGGDPRMFTPDTESCMPEEIAAHKAACEAWDRGKRMEPKMVPGFYPNPDGDGGLFLDGSDYGVGIYRFDCEGNSYCPLCPSGPPEKESKGCPECGAIGLHGCLGRPSGPPEKERP